MGYTVNFKGCNITLLGGAENIEDIKAFYNGIAFVTCWQLTEAELEEIKKTGKVYLSVLGKAHPPVYVGSEETVRSLMADYGVWKK